jgi:putative tricarboxylic transport membrane protein
MSEGVSPSPKGTHPGFSFHTDNFLGGFIIAILAVFFLGCTFLISSPTVPRIMSIVVAVVGVTIAAGLLPVRNPRDLYGGLALMLMAILALVASAELPGQRGFAFGPGTAPRLFAGLLAALGAAVAVVGVVTDGPAIEQYKIRGPAFVIVSILLFAALIRPFGLIISTFLAFMLSIMGTKEMRWVESVVAAAGMTIFCWLLFVILLNLPFQLWPQGNAHVLLYNQFADIGKNAWLIFQKITGL